MWPFQECRLAVQLLVRSSRVRIGGEDPSFRRSADGAGHVNIHLLSSTSSFATAVGGGFDYKVLRLIGWRLQADYVYTNLFSAKQNNVRVSTGIVFRF